MIIELSDNEKLMALYMLWSLVKKKQTKYKIFLYIVGKWSIKVEICVVKKLMYFSNCG